MWAPQREQFTYLGKIGRHEQLLGHVKMKEYARLRILFERMGERASAEGRSLVDQRQELRVPGLRGIEAAGGLRDVTAVNGEDRLFAVLLHVPGLFDHNLPLLVKLPHFGGDRFEGREQIGELSLQCPGVGLSPLALPCPFNTHGDA